MLDTEQFVFVVGEIIAGLSSIHDLGFVFGDMKPENIVITSSGHAKITDFGGARPLTVEAREKMQQQHLLHLRDGDWKKALNDGIFAGIRANDGIFAGRLRQESWLKGSTRSNIHTSFC